MRVGAWTRRQANGGGQRLGGVIRRSERERGRRRERGDTKGKRGRGGGKITKKV